MIVSIEGIDGAGKTSLAQQLALDSGDFIYLDRKGIAELADADSPVQRLKMALWSGQDFVRDPVDGMYWYFKLLAWYTAIDRLIKPRPGGVAYVVDGWIYRHVIKTSMRTGYSLDSLLSMGSHLSVPCCTVLIEVEPEQCWVRRPTYSEHECGAWDGYDITLPKRDRYIAYQTQVQREYLALAKRLGWIVIRCGNRSMSALSEQVHQVVGEALDRRAQVQ